MACLASSQTAESTSIFCIYGHAHKLNNPHPHTQEILNSTKSIPPKYFFLFSRHTRINVDTAKMFIYIPGLYLFSLVLSGSLVSVTSFLNTGTSPSSPNTSLRSCMREAGYYKRSKSSYRNYRNKFSNSMKRWCL